MAGKSWIKKIVLAALIAEIAYVVLFNLALRLPLTQTLINQIKPDKFQISWEKAWTLYPFRFHIQNAAGNGQARSQQWAFEAQSVSASIDVLPLIFKRVWIDHVRVSDASYFQRPRLKPDKDYSGLIPFYPEISGREITNAITTPLKKKRAWHVDIEDIRLDGQYRYWIHQFRGQARGTLEADLDVVSRGGLFSLRAPDINLELDPHFLNGSQEIFRRGVLSGGLSFAPFVPRENKGIRVLHYLLIDADVDIKVSSLAFIDHFTRSVYGLKISGQGLLGGHLNMEEGKVLEGTDLLVTADNLQVNALSHEISGNGAVQIEVSPESRNELDLGIRFDDMVIMQDGGDTPLLTGHGLMLNGRSASHLLQAGADIETTEDAGFKHKLKLIELEFKVPNARVADMRVFNYYLPPGSPLAFSSGSADLEADILIESDDTGGFLRLKADGIEAQIDDQSIRADLSVDILLVGGVPEKRLLDLTGSELRLDNVRVLGENESFNQKNWATVLTLTQAEITLTEPLWFKTEANLNMTDSRPIVAMLGNQKDRPKWVRNMLTIEAVNGIVELEIANRKIMIPNAFMDSDNIEFGIKADIDEVIKNGVIYARYKKLDIVVKISDGKRNIDVFRARRKFDDYQLSRGFD